MNVNKLIQALQEHDHNDEVVIETLTAFVGVKQVYPMKGQACLKAGKYGDLKSVPDGVVDQTLEVSHAQEQHYKDELLRRLDLMEGSLLMAKYWVREREADLAFKSIQHALDVVQVLKGETKQ
jgi:hypothetical protein